MGREGFGKGMGVRSMRSPGNDLKRSLRRIPETLVEDRRGEVVGKDKNVREVHQRAREKSASLAGDRGCGGGINVGPESDHRDVQREIGGKNDKQDGPWRPRWIGQGLRAKC